MIPQNLIELIESGQAQFRNWCTGGTGSSRIPVPKNNYIVIVGFTWHHFADVDPLATQDAAIIASTNENKIHQLAFRSFGQEYFYGIRSSIYPINPNQQNDWGHFAPFQNDTQYNCYQVHKTDVHVDIWRYTSYKNWLTAFGLLNDKTQENPAPIGYGSAPTGTPALNCVREIQWGAGLSSFFPYGENQGLPLTGGWTEMFRVGVYNVTALFPPDLRRPDAHYTYPLLNIAYVLVNHPFDKQNR